MIVRSGEAMEIDAELVTSTAVTGDSASGAIPIHVPEGETTVLTYVSPYHYYRVPLDRVELFALAGDDTPIVPEPGTDGVCEVSPPTPIAGVGFQLAVTPRGVGNWIVSCRTHGIAYVYHGIPYASRPRTVQFRISTRPPLNEFLTSL